MTRIARRGPRLPALISAACGVVGVAACVAPAVAAAPASRGAWTAVQCPHADRALVERFERVRGVDDFEAGPVAWRAVSGDQQAEAKAARAAGRAHGGSAALRVDYRFAGRMPLEYVEVARSVPIAKSDAGLGLWVFGNGSGLFLRIRVQDRSGETHQYSLLRLTFTGWRYAAVAFGSGGEGAWGGDGNRRLDFPCRLHSILADRPRSRYKGEGRLWIDDVEIVRPRKMESRLEIEVLGERLGNVYEVGEQVSLRAGGGPGTIRWHVRDFWGRNIAAADGPQVQFPLRRQGWYAAAGERVVDGKPAEVRLFRCAALAPAEPKRRNSFVAVGCHFRGGAYPLECMDLLARLGIGEFRDEISWSAVERQKGRLAMPDYGRAFTARAKALALRPLLIFDYGNAHYEKGGYPVADESVAAYARYAAFLAGELKGSVEQFEVWNEYSIACGMRGKPRVCTPQTYARMLAATYAAVKKANPRATVVGVGGEHSKHHLSFIEGMLEAGAGKNMDAWSVHSYRYPRTPEASDLVGEIKAAAALGAEHDAPRRLWVTEIGWPTHTGPRGVDERTQACLLVRTFALLQATGAVEKVYWYDFKDDGLRREYNEHNFGVVHHQKYNLAPKPAAVALSIFARMTAGAKVTGLRQQGDLWAVIYSLGDGRDLVVAWTPGKPAITTVRGSALAARDLMGTSASLFTPVVPAAAGQKAPRALPVRLSQAPVYLVGNDIVLGEKPG